MAIIDRKRLESDEEEAQRRAAEYAARNDPTAAQSSSTTPHGHWDDDLQPPPAYEESSPHHTTSQDNRNGTEGHGNRSQPNGVDRDENDDANDELRHLLNPRRKKKRKFKRMFRVCVHLFWAALVLISITKMLMSAFRTSEKEAETMPEAPPNDGHPTQDSHWTEPIRASPALWPSPSLPLYTSNTSFAFDVNEEPIFASAKGGAYSGQIVVMESNDITEAQWNRLSEGKPKDTIVAQIEVRFSEKWLRDRVRVAKMRRDKGKGQGVGIYSTNALPKYPKDSFLSFHVSLIFPAVKHRTPGHSPTGTSYIPSVQLIADNMRITIEHLWGPDADSRMDDKEGVFFGSFTTQQMNGGLEFISTIKANNSVSFSLQNGPIRDIIWPGSGTSIVAPQISIVTRNGPVWVNKLVGRDTISIKTGSGGINITGEAKARHIEVRNNAGFMGGTYRAEQLTLDSDTANIRAAAWMLSEDGEEEDRDHFITTSRKSEKWSRKRTVKVRTLAEDVRMDYLGIDKGIELHSDVSSEVGRALVEHAHGYEGSWCATTDIGKVHIDPPSTGEAEGEKFLVLESGGWPVGETSRGRIWSGQWNASAKRGQSKVSSNAGDVSLKFH